jgi:hypothetical protein
LENGCRRCQANGLVEGTGQGSELVVGCRSEICMVHYGRTDSRVQAAEAGRRWDMGKETRRLMRRPHSAEREREGGIGLSSLGSERKRSGCYEPGRVNRSDQVRIRKKDLTVSLSIFYKCISPS